MFRLTALPVREAVREGSPLPYILTDLAGAGEKQKIHHLQPKK